MVCLNIKILEFEMTPTKFFFMFDLKNLVLPMNWFVLGNKFHIVLSTLISILFFRNFLKDNDSFYVPEVINELSTKEILTTEYVEGLPLDQCVDLDQETRNKVSDCSYHCIVLVIKWPTGHIGL